MKQSGIAQNVGAAKPVKVERGAPSELVMMVFSAVVFSLLVQGLTISPMLKWPRLGERSPGVREYEALQGRLLADTAALAELDSLRNRGVITLRVYDDIKAELSEAHQNLSQHLRQTRQSRKGGRAAAGGADSTSSVQRQEGATG